MENPQMYDAAIDGRLKAMWVIGEDMAQTDPNSIHVAKALDSLELAVRNLHDKTAEMADVVPLGASFLEKSEPSQWRTSRALKIKLCRLLKARNPMVRSSWI